MTKQYKIMDEKNGHMITSSEAARVIGRPHATIDAWFVDGCTTLQKLTERSDNRSKCGDTIYETINGPMTSGDISRVAGTTTSCVYGRGKRYGWMSVVVFWPELTRQEMKARLIAEGLYIEPKEYRQNNAKGCKKLVDEDSGEKIVYKKIAAIVGTTDNTLRTWIDVHGCKTVKDCMARAKYLEECPTGRPKLGGKQWVVPSSVSGVLRRNGDIFDRHDDCKRAYKNGIVYEKCKWYVSCSDSRSFERKHHDRYRMDGSCYEGERLEVDSFGVSPIAARCRIQGII